MIDLRLLIKNGVHFGHQTARWCPKMAPYIWGFKNGIHLIDVMKTAHQLEKASKFLEGVASEGRTILLVGTKKAAQGSVKELSDQLKLPYVIHRWVGGTFTNYRQVRKAISNMIDFEETLKKTDESHYTKKELNLLKKRAGRLENIVGGIRNLSWPVGAVVVVDVKKESVVVKEALVSGIPVVGLVDTNTDPTDVDYVIPANDDSPRSITLLMNYLGEAIARGQKVAADRPKREVVVVETIVETLYEEGSPEAAKQKAKKAAKAKARKPAHRKAAKPAEKKEAVKAKPAKAEEVKAKPAKKVEKAPAKEEKPKAEKAAKPAVEAKKAEPKKEVKAKPAKKVEKAPAKEEKPKAEKAAKPAAKAKKAEPKKAAAKPKAKPAKKVEAKEKPANKKADSEKVTSVKAKAAPQKTAKEKAAE